MQETLVREVSGPRVPFFSSATIFDGGPESRLPMFARAIGYEDILRVAARAHLIVERLKRRDRSALTDLYAKTSSRAYGLIRSIIRDETIAASTLKKVYLEIWQQPSSAFSGEASPEHQVLALARRRALDTHGARPVDARTDSGPQIAPDTPDAVTMLKTAYLEPRPLEELARQFDLTPKEAQDRLWNGILAMKGGRE